MNPFLWILQGNIVEGTPGDSDTEEVTVSKLTLRNLAREQLGNRVWCQSRNTKLVAPLEISVTLDIVCEFLCFHCQAC